MLNDTEVKISEEIGTIAVSASAAQAVLNIFQERQLEGYALRIYVSGGGCCGVNFGMALDNQPRESDLVFQSQGLRVLVDDQSIAYLRGATVDYINDPERGPGFVVNSPANVKEGGSCACGSGSSAKSEEGCGCGGSCSCNN